VDRNFPSGPPGGGGGGGPAPRRRDGGKRGEGGGGGGGGGAPLDDKEPGAGCPQCWHHVGPPWWCGPVCASCCCPLLGLGPGNHIIGALGQRQDRAGGSGVATHWPCAIHSWGLGVSVRTKLVQQCVWVCVVVHACGGALHCPMRLSHHHSKFWVLACRKSHFQKV